MDSSKSCLSKLLYVNPEDRQRIFLNVNLLRNLKLYIIDSLTIIEKGCINSYNLENYLIELTFDADIEEKYPNYEIFIHEQIKHIRSNPDFWIINTQPYIDILNKINPYYLQDPNNLQINKELISVYNYIFQGNFKSPEPSNNLNDNESKMNSNISFSENYVNPLLADNDYVEVLNLFEREEYFNLDSSYRTLFRINVLPLIFKFVLYENDLNLQSQKAKENQFETFKIKLENCIMFFSFINMSYSQEIYDIFHQSKDETIDLINNRSKKFRLRDSKYKNINIEELYMTKIQNLIELREKIDKIKNLVEMRNFVNYLIKHNLRVDFVDGENENIESEIKMKNILFAYTNLYNVIKICNLYVVESLKEETKIEKDFNSFKMQFKDVQFFINTFKNIKGIYKELYEKEEGGRIVKDIIEFYFTIIEKKDNYLGSVELLRRYSSFCNEAKNNDKLGETEFFGSKSNEKRLHEIEKEYINNYYEHHSIKNERIYKIENMALEWSEEDYKRFNEGFKKFRNHQLSNNKIAKYMGSHVEVNHVRYYKNKILIEERKKMKEEKMNKIREMKKKKNIHWKILK